MNGPAPERRVGTTLRGKYRLDRLLGVGGMAAVYAGAHRNGLAVAVKVLHPWAAAEPTIVERFVREGYIANAIEHPGAVRVLDDDVTEDGAVFLVMELLDGRALADVAAHGPSFPLDAALDAADQILDVLASAHAKQIVHRDLKPENLFVTKTGQLKVLDLGIARMRGITGKTVPTRSGALMGTPGFMPPEQVLGEQEKIDARSDLWAVGATLFALLTGHVVHEAATPEQTMLRAATTAVPALATTAPHVPPPIAAVIDRALAMAQEQRWPDARSMQTALRAACAEARVSFATGDALARALAGPAFANTHVATTGARSALSAAVAPPVSTSPPPRRRPVAIVAGLALLASVLGATTFVAKTRLATHSAAASPMHTSEIAAPPPPLPAPSASADVAAPPAPVATAIPASALPSVAAAAPKKTSGARTKASRAAAPSGVAPASTPAGNVTSDPFDHP